MWQGFRQASMARWPATSDVRGPVAQWTIRLTMNQKIAGSSPARINKILCGKDLDRLVWQAGRPQVMSEVLWRNRQCVCTVTRPYAGFRHPDRMAPDQTVRGRENECSIWSGNLLPQVPKFSVITGNFLRFFLWKRENARGGIELTSSGLLILSSTPTPRLPCTCWDKI